mgnify:CR=1 FL=1
MSNAHFNYQADLYEDQKYNLNKLLKSKIKKKNKVKRMRV